MTETQICTVDVDKHDGCLGAFGSDDDDDDVVYWSVAEGPDGFYVSTLIDSEAGSFVEPGVTDDGPYLTWDKANEAGKDHAMEWCYDL
ncbi:MAG: hypothetical protein ACYS7Y_11930 [Planctomycetota bacterium]|jgi:hypothetical protein